MMPCEYGKKRKIFLNKKNKHKLPIFNSDEDFIKAFGGQDRKSEKQKNRIRGTDPVGRIDNNIENVNDSEEDFETLLEESFQKRRTQLLKKASPVPLEKRLKRYPPPEKILDLHGYNALGAEMRSKSFIHSCKLQGFFTVRIIVGKGRHSDEGAAVLPDIVEDVAKEMKKQGLVIGFEWENKIKSKSGALIIYLKQFERFDG